MIIPLYIHNIYDNIYTYNYMHRCIMNIIKVLKKIFDFVIDFLSIGVFYYDPNKLMDNIDQYSNKDKKEK